MARYKHTITAEKWTTKEVKLMLDALLPCKDRCEFNKTCDDFATRHKRGARKLGPDKRHGDLVRRQLWGLATGYKKYYGAANLGERCGLAVSWTERKMIYWAANEGKGGMVNRLAYLMRRKCTEVEDMVKRFGPALGRKGFGLV